MSGGVNAPRRDHPSAHAPEAAEYLFQPLTYLSPTGETLEVDDAIHHVVDVKPRMFVSTKPNTRVPTRRSSHDSDTENDYTHVSRYMRPPRYIAVAPSPDVLPAANFTCVPRGPVHEPTRAGTSASG